MFEGYDEVYDGGARLSILLCLAEREDGRLSDSMLDDLLTNFHAINRGRAYVRTQIAWLENSAGAVRTEKVGGAVFCQLTEVGHDHITRRYTVPGIKKRGFGKTT